MSITERLCQGEAEICIKPLKRDGVSNSVVLHIDGKYWGEFPTYTAACDHILMLAND